MKEVNSFYVAQRRYTDWLLTLQQLVTHDSMRAEIILYSSLVRTNSHACGLIMYFTLLFERIGSDIWK